jgi:hypothetical protein
MQGPKISLKLSCYECEHCKSTPYRIQGDSGHDVSCKEPSIVDRHIADTRWDTPEWCPLRAKSLAEFKQTL